MSEALPCAIWYWTLGVLHVSSFESEQQAAEDAAELEVRGEASVEGVQFADGVTVAREVWKAFGFARAQLEREEEEALLAAGVAHRATQWRTVRSPFSGNPVKVNAEKAPAWLGS